MVTDRLSPDVDSYLEKLPPERRAALQTLREMILQAAPQAQESMRYGLPTYEYPAGTFGLAAQKQYLALYMDVTVVENHRAELGGLSIGKSCIRFKRLDQLPLETIQAMLIEAANRDPSGG
jgi:uncharacterized protein YdhG (YjbR/CyaY superfamily)